MIKILVIQVVVCPFKTNNHSPQLQQEVIAVTQLSSLNLKIVIESTLNGDKK